MSTVAIPREAEGLTPQGERKYRSRRWANRAARETMAPDFVGQVGYQISDNTVWIGVGLSQDAWRKLTTDDLIQNLLGAKGKGTYEKPWTDWEDAALGLTAPGYAVMYGTGWYEAEGELLFTHPFVPVIGKGRYATYIRSRETGANKAIMRFSYPTNAAIFVTRVGGFTLDGMGETPIGLYLRQVNHSLLMDITFRGMTDYAMITSQSVGNSYHHLNVLAFGPEVGVTLTQPANGFLLADTDAISGDESATVSDFYNCELALIPGTAVEVKRGFSMAWHGGSMELCGVPIKTHADTSLCVFDTVDMEGSTGAGMQIGGSRHRFRCIFAVGTDITLTADSTGGHFFDAVWSDNAKVDNGTGTNEWVDCGDGSLMAGSNANNNVFRTTGRTVSYKKGSHLPFTASRDNIAGHAYWYMGGRIAYCPVEHPTGGLYLIEGGGVTNPTNKAELDAAGGLNILGTTVLIGLLGSNADPITGTTPFRVGAANGMVMSFRDFATGQGWLAVGNGTITAYAPHINSTDGVVFGSFTNHKVTFRTNNTNVMQFDGQKLGLFGAAPVVKQTVTGSRGGNAALASLLTALSNFGFITDSTT